MEFSTEFVCMREKFDKTEMMILSLLDQLFRLLTKRKENVCKRI